MIRGTTPNHTFTLPFDVKTIAEIHIIYSQGSRKLVKRKSDCTLKGNTVTVKFTQDETLSFDSRQLVELQVRVLTNNGEALASTIWEFTVQRLLEDEVIA
jgi:hypothetical protein